MFLACNAQSVSVQWHTEFGLIKPHLVSLLRTFGDLLPDPLGDRVDLDAYAAKLLTHADIACAFSESKIVGLLALYANDSGTRLAHIPIVAVLPEFQGRGVGKVLLSRAVTLARKRHMKNLCLQVLPANLPAHRFYQSFGFQVVSRDGPKWRMNYAIPELLMNEQPTPVREYPRLADRFGLDVDLRLKCDDLYPLAGGGMKARKIRYIFRDMIEQGCDVMVTNGGPQSNHARAAAILAAQLGIKCHLVIVLEEGRTYLDSGNILLMRLSGATMEFCAKNELAAKMDLAMERYQRMGHRPMYVWGGGHCHAGTEACVDAAAEARQQCGSWVPDYLVFASGTGTTHAGLAIGYADLPVHVIGISVARDMQHGTEVVRSCIRQYFETTGKRPKDIEVDFRDAWIDGGYEKTSTVLLDLISSAAAAGVFLDSTYSGKAFKGLVDLINTKEIPPGSRVLFWHTGGLMNLQASPFSGGVIKH